MASDAQIQANLQNAQLSTGPRSPEGKQRVAANALKHGLTGQQIVLPNEEPDEFDAFRSALRDDLDPRGMLEELLVDKIVADAWRLRRVTLLEAAIHAREKAEHSLEVTKRHLKNLVEEPLLRQPIPKRRQSRLTGHQARYQSWLEREAQQLDRTLDPTFVVTRVLGKYAGQFDNLSRHEEALTRSMLRGLHELERLQRRRAGESVAAPAALDVEVNVNQNGRDGSAS